MNKTLYDILDEFRDIADLLEDVPTNPEFDGVDSELIEKLDAWFQSARFDLSNKLDGYGRLIRNYEARAEARHQEATRLSALAESDQRAADRLKQRLLFNLRQFGIKKIDSQFFKFSVNKNGGKLPFVPELDKFRLYEFPKEALVVKMSLGNPETEQAFEKYGAHSGTVAIDPAVLRSLAEASPAQQAYVAALKDPDIEVDELYALFEKAHEEFPYGTFNQRGEHIRIK